MKRLLALALLALAACGSNVTTEPAPSGCRCDKTCLCAHCAAPSNAPVRPDCACKVLKKP